MATVHRLPPREIEPETLLARLIQLVKLEMELGLAEVRAVAMSAARAVAVVVVSGVTLPAAFVVLVAAAVAPLVGARWEHLLIAGGVLALLAGAGIAWGVWRLRSLTWPSETLTSVEETWRWLAAQMRSRLTFL